MLPALALGAERPGDGLMRQPPRRRGEGLLSWGLLSRVYLWLGPLQAAAAMCAFFFVLRAGGWTYGEALATHAPLYLQATTACLAAIVVAQVVNVFACRDPEESLTGFGWRSNPLLLTGVAVEVALVLAIVYTPPGQAAFGTAPLPAQAWGLMIALGIGFGLLEETRKAVRRWRRAAAS
jgi:magnesium-transporting ATPase (P-type)